MPEDVRGLAKSLGVGVKAIEEWKRNPKVYQAVAMNNRLAAIYLMPEVLEKQAELAIEKRDSRAARFVAEVAGVLDRGQKIEVHNTNVNNSTLEIRALPDKDVFGMASQIWSQIKEAEVLPEESVNGGE